MESGDNGEVMRLRIIIEAIKERVVGNRTPNWKDDWAVTMSRSAIADLCDRALHPEMDISR